MNFFSGKSQRQAQEIITKNDGTHRVLAFLSGLSILHSPQNPFTIFSFSFSRTGSYSFVCTIGCTSASSMKNKFSS
ncbi:hypothetical protein PSG01_17920, partial [Proteus mirabilis]|uniref:hypothetical protein n=1 Tax=Proteus mirabilis TaxID=584 RepID=UPI0023623BAD